LRGKPRCSPLTVSIFWGDSSQPQIIPLAVGPVNFHQAAWGPDEDHAKASRTVHEDGNRPTRPE
jgi:hypothetical protein